MPKQKSNRGAKKRFRVTGTGKVTRSHAFLNHILTKKTSKRKRKLGKSSVIDDANMKSVKKMLLK